MDEIPRLLNSKAVAKFLGVSESMLCRWRAARKGPPYFDLEGNPRYRLNEIEHWLDETRKVNAA